MTIVLALQHEKGVTIGCDRRFTASDDLIHDKAIKWHVNEYPGLSVGISGSPFVFDTIGRLALTSSDPFKFCEDLRSYFRDQQWSPPTKEHGLPPRWDLNLLLTDRHSIWEVGGTMYPMLIPNGEIGAIGSGYQVALGAMYALRDCLPEDRVARSIETTCRFNAGCGGNPWIRTLFAPEGD